MNWKPIDDDAKTGMEVLLGFAGSRDMDFYRWNQDVGGWLDRCADPPHEAPTHYMIIDGPEA